MLLKLFLIALFLICLVAIVGMIQQEVNRWIAVAAKRKANRHDRNH